MKRPTEADKEWRAHEIVLGLFFEAFRGKLWASHAILEGKGENLTGCRPRMSIDKLFEQYPSVEDALATIERTYTPRKREEMKNHVEFV